MQPVMRLMVAVRALTGAGSAGLTMLPLGSSSVIGRKQPAVDPDAGRGSGRDVQIGASPLDHHLQQGLHGNEFSHAWPPYPSHQMQTGP